MLARYKGFVKGQLYPAQAIAIVNTWLRSVLSRLPVLFAAVGPRQAARVMVCVQLQVKQRLGLAQVNLRKVQARNAIS